MIGRGTIQGYTPRIPAFLHQVERAFEWVPAGLVDMERLAYPALLNPKYPRDHSPGDQSAIVNSYRDTWWYMEPDEVDSWGTQPNDGPTWTSNPKPHLDHFESNVRLYNFENSSF